MVNGHTLSKEISVQRGVHQGCPLSPALFVLAVEVLAIRIRSHPNIEGAKFTFDQEEYEKKLSQFADDLFGFLKATNSSLQAFLNTIHRFGVISGLHLNVSKSKIIPLGLNMALPPLASICWNAVGHP